MFNVETQSRRNPNTIILVAVIEAILFGRIILFGYAHVLSTHLCAC